MIRRSRKRIEDPVEFVLVLLFVLSMIANMLLTTG